MVGFGRFETLTVCASTRQTGACHCPCVALVCGAQCTPDMWLIGVHPYNSMAGLSIIAMWSAIGCARWLLTAYMLSPGWTSQSASLGVCHLCVGWATERPMRVTLALLHT